MYRIVPNGKKTKCHQPASIRMIYTTCGELFRVAFQNSVFDTFSLIAWSATTMVFSAELMINGNFTILKWRYCTI